MRIGNKMMAALYVVGQNPGCSKKYVAERISPCPVPSKNWAYGYNPVNRCIAAGLVAASPAYAQGTGRTFRYELDLTIKGRDALEK